MRTYVKLLVLSLVLSFFQCSDSGTSTSYLPVSAVLSKVSGDFTTAIAGIEQTTELIVLLSDDVGRPLKGWQVDYTLIKGAASLTPSSSQTDDDGMARTTLSWGSEEGIIEVEARALGAGTSVRFLAASSLSAVDTLLIASKNLVGEPGMEIRNPLVIEARDAGGQLVKNTIITFSNGDAELRFADDYLFTDEDGQVENIITIGNAEGDIPYMVTAYAGNRVVSQNFEIFSLGNERIVYSSTFYPAGFLPHSQTLFLMNPDGSGQVHITDFTEFAQMPDWSPDGGKIVYVSQNRSETAYSLKTMNFDGSGRQVIQDGIEYLSAPAWSPAGDVIAFIMGKANFEDRHVWIINVDGSGLRQLTSGENSFESSHSWHPDGSKIMFTRYHEDKFRSEIYTMNPDGTELTLVLGEENFSYMGSKWSNDGKRLLYHKAANIFEPHIYVANADGSNEINIQYTAGTGSAQWSPDDSKIIYTKYSGYPYISTDIFIMNEDGTNQTRVTSTFGYEYSPKWIRKK